MNGKLHWFLAISLGLLLGLGAIFIFLVISMGRGWSPIQTLRYGPNSSFRSNGERIYITGTDEQGNRIRFSDGPPWLYMRGGSCISCHGPDGRGGPIMMTGEVAPDIRYSTLTGEHHEDHPPYTDELIKRAITQGVDPAGNALSPTMPRWHLSDKDLNDLLDYLKALK